MTEGQPGFVPPSDCGNSDDTGRKNPRYQLWDDAKSAPDPFHHGYVIFGGEIMGFKPTGNGLLVPNTRIMGIECPKVVGPGAQNYWPAAWHHAEALNLPDARTLVSVNSKDGRTQDQLHFHLTVLKKGVREQLDSLDPNKFGVGSWNSNRVILVATDSKTQQDDTYVYRIAHVDSLDKNPFDVLNDNVATQRDDHGNLYNDRFAQSLAAVRSTKAKGFFLIATQGRPTQKDQPSHKPDLDMSQGGKRYFGAKTVEALIDRDWKPL